MLEIGLTIDGDLPRGRGTLAFLRLEIMFGLLKFLALSSASMELLSDFSSPALAI